MPLFVKNYQWEQSSTQVFITVPLKGAKKTNVSVLQSENYIKISFPPYIFESCFEQTIQPEQTYIKVADGHVNIRLEKKESLHWGDLNRKPFEDKAEEKEFLLKLREEAVEFNEKASAVAKDAKAADKTKKDRFSVQQQLKLEQEERKRIEDYKSSEKNKAVKELLDFQNVSSAENEKNMQSQIEHFKNLEEKLAEIDSDEDELEILQEKTKYLKEEKEETEKQEEHERKTQQVVSESQKKVNSEKQKTIFEEHEISKCKVRGSGNIDIKFTPRVFPTPARESRKPEEDEWLAKQVEARERASIDDTELTEAEKDPALLKQKGNTFFQQGNFQGAVNVFTHAIKLFPKMPELYSNRAACHLKMRNFFKALEDSSKAIEFLTPAVEANAKDRMKAFMRRGTAFCELECYAEGLIEYEAALKIDPKNEQLIEDCAKLRAFVQGSYHGEINRSPQNDDDDDDNDDDDDGDDDQDDDDYEEVAMNGEVTMETVDLVDKEKTFFENGSSPRNQNGHGDRFNKVTVTRDSDDSDDDSPD